MSNNINPTLVNVKYYIYFKSIKRKCQMKGMYKMDFDRMIEQERLMRDPQEMKIYTRCDRCNVEIYEGGDYYFFERNNLCEDCFDEIQNDEKFKSRRIAGDNDE